MFQYISFRTAMSFLAALLFSIFVGKRFINYLRFKQIGETVRDLGLAGQYEKSGTPTMGGLIIIMGILIPTLLFAKVMNIYIVLMLVTTLWLGAIGFVDDYIKTFKKNKAGLAGKFKVLGQITLGLIIGLTVYLNEGIVVKEKVADVSVEQTDNKTAQYKFEEKESVESIKTTIPFVKNNELDYSNIIGAFGDWLRDYVWVFYILVVILIITAVSNGANITDGLDGLAAGSSTLISTTLGILAYVSGNIMMAGYLNIMYIPNVGELVVFTGALVGALTGFMWFNSYPAQVFMGDTGSLSIGGIIAVFAILIRKELLIPLLCGIFLVENISVMIQVSYFKYTKKKYGEGRRIFLMSPLHHHYQKKGIPEAKIVTRFWIVGAILAVLTIVTLKIR